VSVPYGPEDLTAAYRVLSVAAELGTAIVATRPAQPAWQTSETPDQASALALTLSDPRVASVILPLPMTAEEAGRLVRAARHPSPESQWRDVWDRFRERVPEPPKPRGAHPPEYGV
jgi:hypothetical protein